MYSIYPTNKLGYYVHVRLSVDKMQYADDSIQKIKEEILDKQCSWTKGYISLMALGGFCLIPAGQTRAFSVENVAASIYVSVVNSSILWVVNFPVDPKMCGCMAILSDSTLPSGHNVIAVLAYNPEAVWLPAKSGDQLTSDIIKAGAGIGRFNQHLYLGRKGSVNGGIPCTATSDDDKLCSMWLVAGNDTEQKSGEFLKNTGFELIRAKRGDPISPNAVMTGVTEADGSLYVGRVGGSIPCYITTEEGKIQSFVYGSDTEKRVTNGEVMVLTR